jgi:hypothetical protein
VICRDSYTSRTTRDKFVKPGMHSEVLLGCSSTSPQSGGRKKKPTTTTTDFEDTMISNVLCDLLFS